ncbi:hypothetical protein RR48_00607 [Papilio machaon]|uniref:Uncharacterized protein n=1 Tax=Papilio machaon TaxID=76193 RepID=A0A0N1PJR7_PAPMA|nr:hypothetical protein RR48_00607 [Papilio machaon]
MWIAEVRLATPNGAATFEEENCSAQKLLESGTQTLLAVYKAPKSVKSLDHLRNMHYVKSTKLNKPVQLLNIPLTSAAARQHFNRVSSSNLVST